MRGIGRIWIAGVVACCVVAVAAPAAQGAFGVESFFAANCKVSTCNKAANPSEEKTKAEKEGYSQAAGHPPFGVTDFTLNSKQIQTVPFPAFAPEGNLKNLRVDVAPGVSTNPQAVNKCSVAEFTSTEVEPVNHLFLAPKCPESGAENTVIGENIVHTVIVIPKGEPFEGAFLDVELKGKVYNLVQPNGMSSYFGVALPVAPGVYAHTFLEGHVEWASNYHDYFEIKNITPGLIESRLIFNGNVGTGGFLTNPSHCSGPGPQTTTQWHGESYEGAKESSEYTTPIGTEGCNGLAPFSLVPFSPTFSVLPETKQSDLPDGVTTELVLPHDPNPEHIDSAQLRNATVVLPEGMTLNPSAAKGLEACTPAQARIHSPVAGMACPAKSSVGSVSLEVPDLPPGSLKGNIYLGGPETGPITGPPYTIYIDAESARYGVSVRLEGKAEPNLATGRLTTTFLENPEQPFSDLILHFTPGALSPIANPLVCATALAETSLLPYTGLSAVTPSSGFKVDSNNSGGACASPLRFALSQSSEDHPSTGGANAGFTLNLSRSDGNQYLQRVSAKLPEGLVGKIPAVPLCPEPQASQGTCSTSSQIGTATVLSGAGTSPTSFSGPVYLTGPYAGAPYGMTVLISTAVGPFNLGPVVVRATIEVDPLTGRVTVASTLPTIVKGIPVRMKSMSVAINHPGFLINPTNCSLLAIESRLSSTFGATQLVSSPFQATGCNTLSFKPKFGASVNAFTSRANGASFAVSIGYPTGVQANIKSVVVTLPKQLPSRLDTLKKACPEAIFNSTNPYNCPPGSYVGGATVVTPVLPKPLSGRVFFVSHGGAAFPDIDMVLGGNGVTIILVGNTNISKGITTTTFASIPDAPVSSFHMNLPYGKFSALGGHGNLCAQPLIMPTTLTAQNGVVVKQNTRIAVKGCVKVLSHRVHGHRVTLTIQAAVAGRLRVGGGKLASVGVRVRKAGRVTVTVGLSAAGLRALKAHKPLNVSVAVRLTVSKSTSYSASTKVRFR